MFDYNIHKKLSAKNINDNSMSYIKEEIAKRLLDRLLFMKIHPKRIAIVGYLSDPYIQTVKLLFKDSVVDTVANHNLKYDLIIVNTDIHLTENISLELQKYLDMLNFDADFLFSSFSDNSLSEIKLAWKKVDVAPHNNNMPKMLDWNNLLIDSSFINPVIENEVIKFSYESLSLLFKDIRQMKEPLADNKMRHSITGKNRWKKFIDEFKKTGLFLSFDIVYVYAKTNNKAVAKNNNNGEAKISISQLKMQLNEIK